jgi:hypothetical protein
VGVRSFNSATFDAASPLKAIKTVQALAGLEVTGTAGVETKRVLVVAGLTNDGGDAVAAPSGDSQWINLEAVEKVTWSVDAASVPSYLPLELVAAEFAAAFAVWQGAVGHGKSFVQTSPDDATKPMISLRFDDRKVLVFGTGFVCSPGGVIIGMYSQCYYWDVFTMMVRLTRTCV